MSLSGKRVLYISYNGMLQPLGQSQVIPYLRELSKLGVEFSLLSFERPDAFLAENSKGTRDLKRELAEDGIDWHLLRYHKSPSLPATAFDVIHGIHAAKQIFRRKRIDLVHARSHIPAMIALRLKRRFGVKMIFDLRGLMAEEYVDAEHWSERDARYRLTKSMESRIFANADAIVTLTEKIWPIIGGWQGLRNRSVEHEVVPCCADLTRYRFSEQARRDKRAELRVSDNQNLLVYCGSIGGWYLTGEMTDLFAHLAGRNPNWHFLWLTHGPAELINTTMQDRGIAGDRYTIIRASPADVPMYLSAADTGVAFYKPALSRLATSPVKVAEYLGCGLPIVLNAGIGDSDELINGEGIGALLHNFNEVEYEAAARSIEQFVTQPEQTRTRARAVAEQMFDVRKIGTPRYARLYERLLADAN